MLGSANISGGRAMHIMTGNLSYQIEHHLYPDLPSNRYQEIAPRVQAIFEEYGLSYTVGPLPKQVASAWGKVVRLSLPNGFGENLKRGLRRGLGIAVGGSATVGGAQSAPDRQGADQDERREELVGV